MKLNFGAFKCVPIKGRGHVLFAARVFRLTLLGKSKFVGVK